MAEGLKCTIRIEALFTKPNAEVTVRVQTQLPDTNQLNAQEAWEMSEAVCELPITALQGNLLDRIAQLFGLH